MYKESHLVGPGGFIPRVGQFELVQSVTQKDWIRSREIEEA
jgi:hypothetical protein